MPSMTLSPGGVGGAVVSDNITVHHLLNVKRLAYELRRPPAEAWTETGVATPAARGVATGNGGTGGMDPDLVARVVRAVLAETSASTGQRR
jgi:acetaldehyde dehydrogenase (acetylating)